MRKTIVYFLFKNSTQTFQVIVPESEASRLVKHWRENRTTLMSGYLSDEQMHWTLDPADISCVFTRDYEATMRLQQAQQQAQQQGRPSAPPSMWGYGPSTSN